MQRVEHILEWLQVVVAGLAIGVVAGLAAHVVITDPSVLSAATPAYAQDDFTPVELKAAEGTARVPATADDPIAGDESIDKVKKYERDSYYYASLGRRDPFSALVGGDFDADGDVGLPDVADLELVGIAWDAADKFAMAEDSRGFGYVLRVGDRIRGGKVTSIRRDSVTFGQYNAGELSTITLELPIQEDS